jgi:serine/threonine protein kinase
MSFDPARLEEIFGAAVTQPDLASRAAYLGEACGSDAELRARVAALLAAHDAAGDFLKLPEADANHASSALLSEAPGTMIGHYTLLEQIGEGGFAVVFMAQQEQPVRRRVALKIIKLGMDTRQIVARFEAERQALAVMDHPSIAKVFDAGATGPASGCPGRPYFVMELVAGVPITAYCDEHSFTIDERLSLFQQVCHAVQHAHQKGVIHRDIKPNNVLVSTQDGQPLAKVIDFGIAKATQTPLTDKTLFTDFRQLIGTPAYMSPEQAEGSLDIDTRSDVYSLGVLLYELLAGSPPFDPHQLRSKSFSELQRTIREVEPPTPSARISSLDAETQFVTATRRQTEPRRLKQLIRGDLNWIVMRCLEKDRRRRYQTASALAQDIERYCGHLPIEAHQRAWIYAFRKWIRRNQVVFLAGSAIIAALIVGLALAVAGFVEARRQTKIARAQAARSEKTAQFLKDMLEAGGHANVGQLAELDRLFDDALLLDRESRLVRAVLLRNRGAVRAEIGQWDEAVADCVKANELALDGGIWSFDSAIVLLKSGNVDEYRRVCHAYLQRASQESDFTIKDMAAKVSLLLPVGGNDFTLACELADLAATETEPRWHLPCVRLGKALAEYRRGHFESAIDWSKRAMDSESITPRHAAAAHFVQASGYAQLRQTELARQALGKGDELLQRPRDAFTKVFGDTWCDLAIAEHLRCEAAELLARPAISPNP